MPPTQKESGLRVDGLDRIQLPLITITHHDRRRDLWVPRFYEIKETLYCRFCAI